MSGPALGGAAIGLPVGAANDRSGDCMAIGFPVGAGVGLATGWLTPGVNFKASKDEDVLVELKVDCSLYNDYVQQYSNTTTTIIDKPVSNTTPVAPETQTTEPAPQTDDAVQQFAQ